MRFMSIAVLGVIFCSSLAGAEPPPANEQLFIVPPKGWVIGFHEKKDNVEVTEVLPPSQTLKNWTEMLTVQIIGGNGGKSPQDVLKDQLEIIKSACDDIGAGQVSLAVENGFETAMRAVACPKSKQWADGEVSLYKVITGRDRAYVVWRSWRGPAFTKDHLPVPSGTTAEWLGFMRQVMLCDSSDPKHACPDPSAPKAPGAK